MYCLPGLIAFSKQSVASRIELLPAYLPLSLSYPAEAGATRIASASAELLSIIIAYQQIIHTGLF
jgi:hypothetical protein